MSLSRHALAMSSQWKFLLPPPPLGDEGTSFPYY